LVPAYHIVLDAFASTLEKITSETCGPSAFSRACASITAVLISSKGWKVPQDAIDQGLEAQGSPIKGHTSLALSADKIMKVVDENLCLVIDLLMLPS
jgi:hypothetical protein